MRRRKEELVDKTTAAVKDRLTQEIRYWDHRAIELKEQELAGRVNARLNSGLARQRADELGGTPPEAAWANWSRSGNCRPCPPVVSGAALIVPAGLLATKLQGQTAQHPPDVCRSIPKRVGAAAMPPSWTPNAGLGFLPKDVSDEKRGYDMESSIPGTGRLRFIEVKGRAAGAKTVTVTQNEILTALNKPEEFILAIVEL